MNLKDFTTLRKLMMLTTSTNDAEALTALRKANALLLANGVDWDKVFGRTVTVVNDFEPAEDDVPASQNQARHDKMIDAAFEVLERKSLRNGAEDFIASLHEQWLTRRSLSEKQQEALFKFARNAEEGR